MRPDRGAPAGRRGDAVPPAAPGPPTSPRGTPVSLRSRYRRTVRHGCAVFVPISRHVRAPARTDPESPERHRPSTESPRRRHGIGPDAAATQRAAASSARSGPPTIQPAASASPGAGRVDDLRAPRAPARSSPSNEQPRAPRLRIHGTPGSGPPKISSSSSFANTTSGSSDSTSARKPLGAGVADRAPRGEVDADAGARSGAPGRSRDRGRATTGSREERVAGDVQVVAGEPGGSSSTGSRRRRDTAVGEHRALAVPARRARR